MIAYTWICRLKKDRKFILFCILNPSILLIWSWSSCTSFWVVVSVRIPCFMFAFLPFCVLRTVSWIPWKLLFLYILFHEKTFFYISRKCILLPNMIKACTKQCCDATMHSCSHCTGQFTPKMKANAVSHLLSSLVWIDLCLLSAIGSRPYLIW